MKGSDYERLRRLVFALLAFAAIAAFTVMHALAIHDVWVATPKKPPTPTDSFTYVATALAALVGGVFTAALVSSNGNGSTGGSAAVAPKAAAPPEAGARTAAGPPTIALGGSRQGLLNRLQLVTSPAAFFVPTSKRDEISLGGNPLRTLLVWIHVLCYGGVGSLQWRPGSWHRIGPQARLRT